ncbi:MAG: ECF-type sigma factor [Gemmatimonadota bacterium]
MPAESRAVDQEDPRAALDRLTREVYDDLRVIARRQLALRAGAGTLSTTGLVHEAWLKLRAQHRISWNDEAHFMALACLAMRHVLVDRAKARCAHKRGGFQHEHSLDDALIPADAQPELLLQLNDAIDRLAAVDLRLAQVVDCRFFGGLSDQEIAAAMGVTPRTVQRDWLKARMLLRRAMAP